MNTQHFLVSNPFFRWIRQPYL